MFYYPLKPTRISIESRLFTECDINPNYVAQQKIDGWRVQITKENGQIGLVTRHNKQLIPMINDVDWQRVTAELLKLIKPIHCILDGEFLHRRGDIKETFYVWDMFELENKRLNLPYGDRKKLTDLAITDSPLIGSLENYPSSYKKLWQSLDPKTDEGLVIKDLTEKLYLNYQKTIKSPRQFKILLKDPRNLLGDKDE